MKLFFVFTCTAVVGCGLFADIEAKDPANMNDRQACSQSDPLPDGGVLVCRKSDQACPLHGYGIVCTESISPSACEGDGPCQVGAKRRPILLIDGGKLDAGKPDGGS